MPVVNQVQVVLANTDRVTLRVGEVYLKIDADQRRADIEVEAMALAPVPTPQVRWRQPPVLALAALPGTALGRLGEPSAAPPATSAWSSGQVSEVPSVPDPRAISRATAAATAASRTRCGSFNAGLIATALHFEPPTGR